MLIFHDANNLFCFFLLAVGCYHPLNIPLYQTLSLHLLLCYFKNSSSISWAVCSHSETYTLASGLGLTLLVKSILACLPWSCYSTSLQQISVFKNEQFRFITYLPYFFQVFTSFMSLWFLCFRGLSKNAAFHKVKNVFLELVAWYVAWYKDSPNSFD